MRLKQAYGWLYEALIQLLAEDDAMGLLSIGAPHNKYEPEVDIILQHMPEAQSPNEVGRIIYDTYVHCFGSTFSSRSYESTHERTQRRFTTLGEKARMRWNQWKGRE